MKLIKQAQRLLERLIIIQTALRRNEGTKGTALYQTQGGKRYSVADIQSTAGRALLRLARRMGKEHGPD